MAGYKEIDIGSVKEMSDSFRLSIKLFVLLFTVNAFIWPYADNDLWGHLTFGEEIWTAKSIPATDTYSYTANGERWINHEWVTEVLFHLIFSTAGSSGLLFFKLIIGLSIILLLSRLYFSKTDGLAAYSLHFFLLTPVLAFGFATRPQIMTWLFVTFLIVIFHRFFEGQRKAIYWTPLLMLVWINCHGGAVAGIALFGMVTAVELIRGFKGGQGDGKILLPWFLISCAALFVNPYGYKLLLFFAETIPKNRAIGEWDPVPLWTGDFFSFKILVLLFVVSLFIPGSKKRPWEITLIVFAIIYGFKHQRHTVLTVLLLTPYLPLQIDKIFRSLTINYSEFSIGMKRALQFILIGAIFFQSWDHFDKLRDSKFQLRVNPAVYPLYAVKFMQDNDLNGNILLPFNWGEYAIFKLPQSKVAIDGRFRTVYPDKIFLQTYVFFQGGKGWQYVLDFFPTDIILMNKNNKEMENAPGWIKIYEDPMARIFIRETEPASPWLERFNNRTFTQTKSPLSLEFP